jgi:hypothetical protein
MVLGDKRMKIATLDIVADFGDVRPPCDIALKMLYHRPIISMKTNIAKDCQTSKLLSYGEVGRTRNDKC